jgi:hypothetical protein
MALLFGRAPDQSLANWLNVQAGYGLKPLDRQVADSHYAIDVQKKIRTVVTTSVVQPT